MRPPQFSRLFRGWPQRSPVDIRAHDPERSTRSSPCPHISASWGMLSRSTGWHLHPANGARPGLTTQVRGLMPRNVSPSEPPTNKMITTTTTRRKTAGSATNAVRKDIHGQAAIILSTEGLGNVLQVFIETSPYMLAHGWIIFLNHMWTPCTFFLWINPHTPTFPTSPVFRSRSLK